MKPSLTIVLTLIVFACHVVLAQEVTDCSTLRVNETGPPTDGTNLPVCGDVGTAQCCTNSYLRDTVKNAAKEALREALKEELEEREEDYGDIVTELTSYLSNEFLMEMATSFPLVNNLNSSAVAAIFGDLSDSLRSNFVISPTASDSFNTRDFVDALVDRIISQAATLLGDNELQRGCIVRVVQASVRNDTLGVLARSVQLVRQSLSSLVRIRQFLTTYRLGLRNFTPIPGCVERFAELSFCGRCAKRIPPLCRNTCNAVVRGCLSPYYSGLFGDFGQLWNTSATIVKKLNTTIFELFDEEAEIINLFATYLQLTQVCGVSFQPGKRSVREADEMRKRTFDDLLSKLGGLTGAFEYDREGPQFCRPESDEEGFCSNTNQGDSESDRDCDSDEICTSECQCWDGSVMRDTDTPAFTGGSRIQDQGNNPELSSDTIDALDLQARELGTPANAFLSGDEISSVVPEGVSIPQPSLYGSVGQRTVCSLGVLLIGALLGYALG